MREMLLGALKSYYVGNINRHIANIEIFLRTSVGIGVSIKRLIEDKILFIFPVLFV